MRSRPNAGEDFENIEVGNPGGPGFTGTLNGPMGALAFDLEGVRPIRDRDTARTQRHQRADCSGRWSSTTGLHSCATLTSPTTRQVRWPPEPALT